MSKTPSSISKRLDLKNLGTKIPVLTTAYAEMLSEAVTFCLSWNKHSIPVTLKAKGLLRGDIIVNWPKCTERIERCYNDLEFATEQEAYGISFLLIELLKEYTVIQRSRNGTGFDYWLGKKGDLFQKMARLEVSGILRNSKEIDKRAKRKVKQTHISKGFAHRIVPAQRFGRLHNEYPVTVTSSIWSASAPQSDFRHSHRPPPRTGGPSTDEDRLSC